MRWNNDRIFMSRTLAGETVGLEEIDDGVWSVCYGPVLLPASTNGRSSSMADPTDPAMRQGMTPGELTICVTEHRSSWRQNRSCDLNEVLALRAGERWGYATSSVVLAGVCEATDVFVRHEGAKRFLRPC